MLSRQILLITPEEVLQDTISSCLCIASRGIPKSDYSLFKDGISRIRNHIIGGKFSGEIAGAIACKVLYLAAAIQTDQEVLKKITNPVVYSKEKPEIQNAKRFSYLKFVDMSAYGYLIEGTKLLQKL